MTNSLKTIAVTALLCVFMSAQTTARERVTADPIAAVTVKQGGSTPITFTFHIENGFHVNSSKPATPELIPTQLHFTLPADLVIAKLQYPAGQLISFPFDPTEKLSVYSGNINIKGLVVAPAHAGVGPYTVHGELKYQACDNNACYPPKKLPVDFNVTVASAPVTHKRRTTGQSPHIQN
jgi:hypothetical protein